MYFDFIVIYLYLLYITEKYNKIVKHTTTIKCLLIQLSYLFKQNCLGKYVELVMLKCIELYIFSFKIYLN